MRHRILRGEALHGSIHQTPEAFSSMYHILLWTELPLQDHTLLALTEGPRTRWEGPEWLVEACSVAGVRIMPQILW